MIVQRWGFAGLAGLVATAGIALWMLFAGPSTLLGIDTGNAGMVLLMTTVWVSLYAIHRLPKGGLENAVSPGEWKAWLGSGFMGLAIVYFLSNAHVFRGDVLNNPEATAVATKLVMLLIAWVVLTSVLGSRWKNQVQEDERDREIAVQASGWGRGALTFCVIGIALMLGFSPAEKLLWATHMMIANMLIFALMWGCLCEYAAAGVYYWRDRR